MILHSQEASSNVALVPRQRQMRPEDDSGGNYMTLLAMLSHPYSRGSSHVTTSDSTVQPVIDFNYLSHPLDMEILARRVVQIERLLERPQFSQILEPSGKRFPRGIASDQRSQADLEHFIRKYSATNYHPCGTCVMIKADLDGVVDANLLVRSVENLRICDPSIFPIIPRRNILSTAYAVAEKGAEIIHSSI